ncbi:MAG: SDR family NAD(P)-dependent oxidoreductase [Gemmatimonadetes bacterium]|nr:SDR family NAD(P)-dependent oxidoreductase [Gemmatimonadota bacterium]
MKLDGRVAVVTGGASGIGRALCHRFAAEGARVVVTDVDLPGAEAVAAAINGVAFRTDVSQERDLIALVAQVEQRVGPIDVFVSNAGIAIGGGPETPDAEWRRIMDINVMAHVWVARVLVPDMIRRGQGYLVNVASAAGLLTQLGSAPYAVTKHAAVAFAEWLAVTYGALGVRVSCVCPLGVKTPMLTFSDERITALLSPEAIEPEAVAEAVVRGMEVETFLILPHPQVREYIARKAADRDRWIKGMQRLHQRLEEQA